MKTAQEILDAIKEAPQDQYVILYKGLIDAVKGESNKLGVILRTTAEDQTHLDNAVRLKADQEIEAGFNKKFKEKYDELDALIFKLTGIEKKPFQTNSPNEKTTEYFERAIKEAKVLGQTADAKMVRELQQQIATINTTHETAIKTEKEKNFNFRIGTTLDADLSTLNIAVPAHITDEKEKQQYIQQSKESIKLNYLAKYKPTEDKDGKIIWNKDDKPELNPQDATPKLAKDILSADFKGWFVPQGKKQNGTGGAGSDPNEGEGGAGGKFKTTKDVHEHLKSTGLTDTRSTEYFEKFEKLTKESGIKV